MVHRSRCGIRTAVARLVGAFSQQYLKFRIFIGQRSLPYLADVLQRIVQPRQRGVESTAHVVVHIDIVVQLHVGSLRHEDAGYQHVGGYQATLEGVCTGIYPLRTLLTFNALHVGLRNPQFLYHAIMILRIHTVLDKG